MLCAACGNDEEMHLAGIIISEVAFVGMLSPVIYIEWRATAGETSDAYLAACIRCGTVRVPRARMRAVADTHRRALQATVLV